MMQPRRRVLVVEDDPDYSNLLQEAFAEAGFQALQAPNGTNALQLLRNEPVDLVVSDFMMPELNGLELCRLLSEQAQTAKLQVILYSANADPGFRRKALAMGALDYLQKSNDLAGLVRHVCELIGATQAAPGAPPKDLAPLIQTQVTQIRPRLDIVMDILQIVALSEDLPKATRAALEAAQRNVGEIQRLLVEIAALVAPSKPEA